MSNLCSLKKGLRQATTALMVFIFPAIFAVSIVNNEGGKSSETSAPIHFGTSAYAAGLGDLFADSGNEQSKFLPVSQAFNVTPQIKDNQVRVVINITPEHYVYKDKLKLSLPEGVNASQFQFSQPAHFVDDPEFGRVAVFDQSQVVATATLTNTTTQAIKNADVTLTWQGCAKAGLCYPPQKEKLMVSLAAPVQTSNLPTKSDNNQKKSQEKNQAKTEQSTPKSLNNQAATPESQTLQTTKVSQVTPQNGSSQEVSASSKSNNQVVLDANTSEVDQNIGGSNLVDGTTVDGTEVNTITANNQIIDGNLAIEQSAQSVQPMQSVGNLQNANNQTVDATSVEAGLIDKDPFGLAEHPWLALLLLFLAGLGLAFTACVYPMIPIVANIVAHQHNPTAMKGFLLTTSYAMGIAVAYGTLGAIIAIFGESLGIIGWLQNPVILLSFAAIFILLALYMLDVVSIRLPHKWSQKLHTISQAGDSRMGNITGSFIAGALSALVVSPCVSAPLAGALVAVSTIGNPILGFAALFVLGCGLSAPLIVLGATQSSFMPKAGQWMYWVKQGFALLLIAVALVLAGRVFMSAIMLLVWAVWFMVAAMWAYSWLGRGKMFTQAIAILLGIWASCLTVGAALGSQDTWQPLGVLSINASQSQGASVVEAQSATNNITAVAIQELHLTTLEQLDGVINTQPKVVVEVTADWCIECRIMQRTLFANPPVALSGWQVVKLDITETNQDSQAILSLYQLFGPPALLYYVDGALVAQQVGEVKRDTFEQTLTQFNLASNDAVSK